MSFGSSVRFEAKDDPRHPKIFWEYANDSKRKKKHHGYKSKTQPHPLRSKSRHEEEAPVVVTKKQSEKSSSNQPLLRDRNVANRNLGDKKLGTAPAQNGTESSRKNIANNRVTKRRTGKQVEEDKIVLTQTQLNAILETIGKLASNREESLRQSVGKLENETSRSQAVDGHSPRIEVPEESITALTKNQDTAPESKLDKPSYQEEAPKENVSQKDTFRNKENIESKPPAGPLPNIQQLSLTEKKRLKWELEKANVESGWSPWGRPGGGAPIKDSRGNVLADFNARKDEGEMTRKQESVPTNSQLYNLTSSNNNNTNKKEVIAHEVDNSYVGAQHSRLPSHPAADSRAPDHMVVEPTYIPGLSDERVTSKPSTLPPAAIRSSFAIGNSAPDAERFQSGKEREKRKWLEELERQKEEQRHQKLREKELDKQPEMATWADRMGGYKPLSLPAQQTIGQSDHRVNSAPMNTTAPLPGLSPRVEQHQDSYLRGQNAFMDPVTQLELEEKRKRNLEHLEAVRKQVEEKERLKREERERQLREEQMEEAKLKAERDLLQRQFEMEQQKAKNKEEMQTKRVEMLKEAMDQAKEEAEREKHQKRLERLWKGGHDVHNLHANFEAKHSPRDVYNAEPAHIQALISTRSNNNVIEPTYIPGLDLTPREQADNRTPAPYTENRVLTPSQRRSDNPYAYTNQPVSPQREFGTQTGRGAAVSRESTDVEYRGPIHEKPPISKTKRVRVRSAAKSGTRSGVSVVRRQKAPVPVKERPSWGYQNPQKKKPVKQSERDPFFEEKKYQSEVQKAVRVKKLNQVIDANADRIPKNTTTKQKSRSLTQNKSEAPVPVLQYRKQNKSPAVPALTQIRDNPSDESQAHRGRVSNRHQSHTKSLGRPLSTGKQSSLGSHRSYRQNRRSPSPPVPALRHNKYDDPYELYAADPELDTRRSKYSDHGPILAPLKDEDFVPFIRTSNILNPAHAGSPMPMSRENTAVERAREAYIQGHRPADFGNKMENIEDKGLDNLMPRKDPIFNPNLVKDHPTNRQEHILQQLGDLKRNLMQKQRELEVGMTTSVVGDPDF